MTRVAIMQPTYLPWLGYFDLIDQVDRFVWLDDVAFSKQSWQQRNRVRTTSGLTWLSVPVCKTEPGRTRICDVAIASDRFERKHWRTLEQSYSKAPFFDDYRDELRSLYLGRDPSRSLALLNIQLIRWLCSAIGLKTELMTASSLGCGGHRGEHVAQICAAMGATEYRSPAGAEAYLLEDGKYFLESGIRVSLQSYAHPEYAQVYKPFLPNASTLDLLFNTGPNALRILREGRRAPRTLDLSEAIRN